MIKKTIGLAVIWLVLVSAMAGCSGGGNQEAPANTDVGTGGSTDGSTNGAADGGNGTLLVDASGDAVPEDVPVMPGAYNLDVIREGSQVNYTVDQEIQAIVDWYAVELASLGWLETRAPDTAIGAMGAMSRENAAGDKLSMNLSYNQVNGATTVTIAISR